jgi:hypothetical protein
VAHKAVLNMACDLSRSSFPDSVATSLAMRAQNSNPLTALVGLGTSRNGFIL